VAYDGVALQPYSYSVIQNAKYREKPQRLYNVKAPKQRKRYFGHGPPQPKTKALRSHVGAQRLQ